MAAPEAIRQFDERLHKLVSRLVTGCDYESARAEAKLLVDDFSGDGFGRDRPETIFRDDWDERWLRERRFVTFFEWDEPVSEREKAQADELVEALFEFIVEAATLPDQEECRKSLLKSAQRYLAMRGINVSRGQPPLEGVKKDLVDAVREIGPGGERTRKAILAHLATKEIEPSGGYAGTCLSELVQRNILTRDGGGYRLPEWD